ncbi:MAG: biotin/lipoyl-containing protein, partial [Longimicrobiales bacterium]|nr:biotin/lipoyl-containing protein [Longimicrobiales bacterium]
MPKEFKLEDPGEGIHEAEILDLEVSEGDRVDEGEILLSVETDKAAVEIPSPFTGVVEEIAVEEGERVRVGDVLLTYTPEGEDSEEKEEDEDEQPSPGDGDSEGGGPPAEPETGGEGGREGEGDGSEAVEEAAHPPDRPVPAAPATRRRARELGVDLHRVEGSGPGGRVTREDVEAFAEEGTVEEGEPAREGAEAPAEAEEEKEREEREEREGAPEEEAPEKAAARGLSREAVELPDFEQWGEVERIPFRSVRRTIGERMARSWHRIPHVTHMDV